MLVRNEKLVLTLPKPYLESKERNLKQLLKNFDESELTFYNKIGS